MTDAIVGSPNLGGTPSAHLSAHMHQAVLDAATQTLGISKHDIRVALRNGQSLADLAQQQGVAESDLVASVTTAVTPFAGSADPAQMAQKIVEHQGALGHGAHLGGWKRDAGSGADALGGTGTPSALPPLPDGSGSLLDITA